MTDRHATRVPAGRALVVGALVCVALGGLIIGIYVAVAVWIGDLLGGSNIWLSVLATAIVAAIFEPARVEVQRWANRIVYGRRATPYEVLSEIARRMPTAESNEGLLERMASMLAAGTGASRAAVWLAEGGGFTTAATSPEREASIVSDAASLPGVVELIEQEGEVLGALTIEKSRGDTLTAIEQDLVADLAGSAALVLRKLRLDEALEAKAGEIQESRRRLVDAQDVERRRLERDLHDGTQQLVVALKVKLGLARQLAESEGSERAVALIDQMADDTQLAIEQIRSLALGIYPPLLQAEGLGAAVPALARLSALDVRVDVSVRGRHPLPLEAAVYFCISEALTNASKHGREPVHVEVSDDKSKLSFEVTDSGPGFDPARATAGAGLKNMADRLEALGGELTITSASGSSTTVSGFLPLPTTGDVG